MQGGLPPLWQQNKTSPKELLYQNGAGPRIPREVLCDRLCLAAITRHFNHGATVYGATGSDEARSLPMRSLSSFRLASEYS
jgi:hypothetical protein